MKNALIVTTQYVNNYGAVLQAYGFHRFLEQNGWAHEFLNQVSGDNCVYEPMLPLDGGFPYRVLQNLRRVPLAAELKRRLSRFAEFRESLLPQTSLFKTQKEVFSAELLYDLYITGGDQMWNRSCLDRPVNLLRFGDLTAPRISYSTSIGSAQFSFEEKQQFFKWLSTYQAISLREASAVPFFEEGVSCPVHAHIDGTFLVSAEEWKKVATFDGERYPENFILVYELLPHPDLARAVNVAKQQYGLPVVVITTNAKSTCPGEYIVRDAGPREFLGFFERATAVVTTSFHGTCFSVINHKPFLSLIRQNEQRINTLLDSFGLSECYATTLGDQKLQQLDFSTMEAVIENDRHEAAAYLGRFFNE